MAIVDDTQSSISVSSIWGGLMVDRQGVSRMGNPFARGGP